MSPHLHHQPRPLYSEVLAQKSTTFPPPPPTVPARWPVRNNKSPGSQSYAPPSLSIMGPEINIDSILALEKRIEEGTEDTIQLKRARNSLLNISTRVPPEILGQIFHWNVIPEGEFDGLEKGSYNFLLVCHHWFQVASGTPELWGFWGNTLQQWSQRYRRSGTAPLDLVLYASYRTRDANAIPFDGPLRDALRDRAASDSIRSIHLRGWEGDLLPSVISSLTPDGGNIRYSGVESLILQAVDLDYSEFLACHRFPKLQHLRLFMRIEISSWDYLKLQAPSLTTLSLEVDEYANGPTTSQLLSILASYPNLQDLSLCEGMVPPDVDDGYTFRVPLLRLKRLHLVGGCRHVFRLLDRLECPDTLDNVTLELLTCTTEDITGILAPYLQDRIQRDHRFQGRLAIRFSSERHLISFDINTVGESTIPTTLPGHGHSSMSFKARFRSRVPQDEAEKLCLNFIAVTPQENVVCFAADLDTHAPRELVASMSNLEDLYLVGPVIYDGFLQPDPPSRTKLFPSLRSLCLGRFTLQNRYNWMPLINYLAHQTSGGQAISFRLCVARVPPDVARDIERLVEEFILGRIEESSEDET